MIKNMTRKGLALGSAAALVVAGFVGVLPAQAATAVTLNASAGSQAATQNGILGQTFNLASTAVGATDASRVRYFVEGANAAELVVAGRFVADLTAGGGYTTVTTAADGKVDKTVGSNKAVTFSAIQVVNDGTKNWTPGSFFQVNLSLDAAVTETRTVTITPFIDNVVGNNEITPGEFTGTPITLTFHKASEITATTTLAPAVVGSELQASVTLDKGINGAAIGGGVFVYFEGNGSAFGNVKTAEWDADEAAFLAESDGNAAASTVYAAQARVGGNTSASNSGAAVSSSVAVGVATAVTAPAITASTNVKTDGTVKAGAGQVVLTSTVTATPKAGQVVTFTIAKGSLRAGASVTAGGKTLASTGATSITVDVTTDADGKAALTLSYAGFAATGTADNVTVDATVLGSAGVVTSTGTEPTLTAAAVANQAVVEASTIGASAVRAIAKGGSVAVTLDLVDQFGGAVVTERRFVYSIANASANVEVAYPTSSITTTGSSTITVTDASTAASGTFDLRVTVQSKDTSGNWVNTSLVNETVASFVMGGPTASTVTTAAAMLATDTKLALQTVDMTENDGRKLTKAFPYTGTGFTLTGVVRAANGAVVGGQAVTVSAAGVGFSTGATSADILRVGSITVFTAANGSYTVHGFSNKSGKVDFTVAAGAASATSTAYYADAALTAGTTLTIDAPAAVTPGSTLMVKAMLVDKYGNAVNATTANQALAISYNGPGLVVSTPTAFVDGALQFGVLLGANDSGTATVTVAVYSGTDKITTQKTITIGAVSTEGARGWTRFLSATNELKIYARDVVGAGKVQFMVNGRELAWIRAVDATDPKLNVMNDGIVRSVFVRDMLVGRNVVEIYVDGVRLDRRIFTR